MDEQAMQAKARTRTVVANNALPVLVHRAGGTVTITRQEFEELAHLGEDHEGPDGRVHRIVSPGSRGRYRWTREELESAHAAMHQLVTA